MTSLHQCLQGLKLVQVEDCQPPDARMLEQILALDLVVDVGDGCRVHREMAALDEDRLYRCERERVADEGMTTIG